LLVAVLSCSKSIILPFDFTSCKTTWKLCMFIYNSDGKNTFGVYNGQWQIMLCGKKKCYRFFSSVNKILLSQSSKSTCFLNMSNDSKFYTIPNIRDISKVYFFLQNSNNRLLEIPQNFRNSSNIPETFFKIQKIT
jgi:hypothetical protein